MDHIVTVTALLLGFSPEGYGNTRECTKGTCCIMGRPASRYVVPLRPRAGKLGMGRAGVLNVARPYFPQGGVFESKCASPHRDETRWREGKMVVVVVVGGFLRKELFHESLSFEC